MLPGDDAAASLREALRLSPENLPLRRLLAETLAGNGRFEEAEAEYREALRRAPGDAGLLLALGSVFLRAGKKDQALVIAEEATKRDDAGAPAFLFHARILLDAGDAAAAGRRYRRALDRDPDAADPALAARLGIAPDGGPPPEEEDGPRRLREDDAPGGEDVAGVEIEKPRIDFSHVGGMEDLKEEIRMKILHPLANAELFKAYGKKIGGGILLYGPPGCGKTHVARATAGEVKASFLSIGIHDVLDMWLGNSQKNLHLIFQRARRAKPFVLFFDEVDALGARRSEFHADSGKSIINQFLSELDGSVGDNEGILVLGATNAPWSMDSAFRRPGRFDQVLFVPPPDAAARAAILDIHLRGKPAAGVDARAVAAKTEGYSGADLRAVVDAAVEVKLREAMKTGRPLPLSTKDLLAAARGVRPSTKEWFATARNYALHANESGQYDDILKYLERR